jgi:hypothetical protein
METFDINNINDTELNEWLTDADKINILKYANEYLHSSDNDINNGIFLKRTNNENLFKYIFSRLLTDFTDNVNKYLADNSYTKLNPIDSGYNNIYFISKHKMLFKYSYSYTQIKNLIEFLKSRDSILRKAVEQSKNIETMQSDSLNLIEEIKTKIKKSNLFKDKQYITFDIVKQSNFSYKLLLNYKYIIINYSMYFNIGHAVSVATKYKKISAALKESFLEGVLDSPRKISGKDADVFMRLCKNDITTGGGWLFDSVTDKRIDDLFNNKVFPEDRESQFKALLLLNKLKGNR